MMRTTSTRTGLDSRRSGISLERFATSTRADFRFAPLNTLLLVAIFVAGLTIHLNLYEFSVDAVYLSLGAALGLAILLRLTQVWEAVVILGTGTCLGIYVHLRPESGVLLVTTVVALLLAPSIQMAYQWERQPCCLPGTRGTGGVAVEG